MIEKLFLIILILILCVEVIALFNNGIIVRGNYRTLTKSIGTMTRDFDILSKRYERIVEERDHVVKLLYEKGAVPGIFIDVLSGIQYVSPNDCKVIKEYLVKKGTKNEETSICQSDTPSNNS